MKLEIDIPDDVAMKFKQFWLDFRDTPLKGNSGSCIYPLEISCVVIKFVFVNM